MKHWQRNLFLLFAVIFCVTYFTENSYRGATTFLPETIRGPLQNQATSTSTVTFTRNGYSYEATPLYDYELTGLVVHKMDYTFMSLYRRSNTFPEDLCVIWGNNISDGVYKNPSLKINQDMRFCFFQWSTGPGIKIDEISNNHLVAQNDTTEKALLKIRSGDQIKIRGRLVDIVATSIGKPGDFESQTFEWKTSTTREDTGAGACETILVDSVEILRKGNPISVFLHTFSFYGIIAVLAIALIRFIIDLRRPIPKN